MKIKKLNSIFLFVPRFRCSGMKMVNDEWCKHAVGGVLGFLQNLAPNLLKLS